MKRRLTLPPKKPADVFLTADEVMEQFRISRSTLDRWIAGAEFPRPRRIRGKRFFAISEIQDWTGKQTGEPLESGETVFGMEVVSDVIKTYPELVDAMRSRREALSLSAVEAEAKSGLQEGYIPKLENPDAKYGRGVGPDTLPLWLGGLRVGIILVDLPRRPRGLKSAS